MSNDSQTSKAWSIVELVAGCLVALEGIVFTVMLVALPGTPATAFEKLSREVPSTQWSSLVFAVLQFLLGAAIIVHAVYRIRQARVTHAAAPPGLRPAENTTNRPAIPAALLHIPGVGYRSFVAWRYLLVFHHRVTNTTKLTLLALAVVRILMWPLFDVGLRFDDGDPLHVLGVLLIISIIGVLYWGVLRYSKLAAVLFAFGIVNALAWGSIDQLAATGKFQVPVDVARAIRALAGMTMLGCFGWSLLAAFFGTLRAFFTFFTTVPIGGVWIGTSALVLVLAVMSGFETDLRDKILGSNAHIQVTREDGDFSDWREVKKKIDAIPGVVASTPYAVSEVVIAANNNGMNVIIKGIDPNNIGNVTNLVKNLDDKDAMRRLAPLIDLKKERAVLQPVKPATKVDPPPDDMIQGGDPVDFSNDNGSGSGSGSGSGAGSGVGSGSAGAGDPDKAHVNPYGGDATRITGLDADNQVLDLLDSDLIRWMVGDDGEPIIHVVDIPNDGALSRRTQALPGILVGRELVKQTHLYTGEEVRVVSPLSDPSNPDATGTPIPFNRDYRVAGVFYTGMYEYDLKFVYVSLDSLQDFLDLGDTVDGIEIRIESGDDTERYVALGDAGGDNAGLIRKALGPGYRVQDWRELNRSLFSALKLEKIAMFLVLGIVILVASFSIIGNLIMVVVEKQREIALLKTLGASDLGVMQLFAVQGMIIGLIGTALGIVTGLLGCLAMTEFGLPLNPDVYYIDRLPIHVDPQSVAAAALTGVLISIGATLYPALLAARVRPAKGMRH